jgi:Pyridine nucleotide-disulphide oxidoreductase
MGVAPGPSPPGDYEVVVVGSGPGGLQTSYCLGRLGLRHAVVSADDGPGGMFRRFPLFERLISWTHRGVAEPPTEREYEAHDQNSLLADEPELRGLVAEQMAEGRRRPARDEMERALTLFAERAQLPVRYGCRWESTRREPDGLVLGTTDGEYRCRAAVFALGTTQPWVPSIPGLDLGQHYVGVEQRRDRYRGRRVLIVGKRNSAFEVGEALMRQDVRELTLVSPTPPELSRLARSPLRPWYLTALDEHVRGAPGRYVLDASVDRVERGADGYRVRLVDAAGDAYDVEADDVIVATGFSTPLGDLPSAGLATVADGRLPALTPLWEGIGLPGAFFAGNATNAARGPVRRGTVNLSSMVCGYRYNARILAWHLAERLGGRRRQGPLVSPDGIVSLLVHELARGPELTLQKGYLARVLSGDPRSGARDDGVLPLELFLDGDGDGLAATLEYDGEERIRPVLFLRRGGQLREEALPAHPLRRFDEPSYRAELAAFIAPLASD